MPRDSRLAKWLKVNETYLELSAPSRRPRVSDAERKRELLGRLGIEICFPLISMNRLIGILLVGANRRRPALHQAEISFISSLLPQAGIALENALLFREQRERFRRMSRADKLATVGELAAGAAHEIRNPLTSIRSSLQYLDCKSARRDGGEAPRARPSRRRSGSTRSSPRSSSFSRPSEIVRERHDLPRRPRREPRARLLPGPDAERVAVIPPSGPCRSSSRATGPSSSSCFLNVFLNAIQAMPAGGRAFGRGARQDGRKGVVSVADTGEGIPEENLDRIFDPFFTTKKGGTGLGLVDLLQHRQSPRQGEIEVRSKPGQGTTSSVSLPPWPEAEETNHDIQDPDHRRREEHPRHLHPAPGGEGL